MNFNKTGIRLDIGNTKGGESLVSDGDKVYDVDLSKVKCGCLYISKYLIPFRHWFYFAQMFLNPLNIINITAEKMSRWKIESPKENEGDLFYDVREWLTLKAERL